MSQPPSPAEQAALQAAIAWYAQLSSGEASANDHAAWQAWRQANSQHESAWLRVESITGKFETVPAAIGMRTLATKQSRRNTLKQLAVLLAVGGVGVQGYRQLPWQSWSADLRTGVGEQRSMTLADGSQLIINTDSALDVEFTATQRLLQLHRGEILITTAKEPGAYRPFVVQTTHGRLTALGTRFAVRQLEHGTLLSVFEHAVSVGAASSSEPAYTVQANMASLFAEHGCISLSPLPTLADSWSSGFLYADNMPLPQFITELERYRPGWLRLAPELNQLRISGSFPLADTEAVLHSLARTLPIRIKAFSRYLVLIAPA